MSSHGGGGDDGGGERWLVSYADFITLLMVMFIVLYSMGQTDVKKFKALAENMKIAFSFGGSAPKTVSANITSGGGTDENGNPNPIVIPGIPKQPPKSVEVAGDLTAMLSKSQLAGQVSIQTNIEGILISLSEKLVFTPGTAEMHPEAFPVLDTITSMIVAVDNPIRIVGHTDTTPPADKAYASNWELSVARAIVISNYMIGKGITPDRITVAGRGEYQPIFDNDTPEHRALNSRADIVIIYKGDSSKVGVDTNKLETP